MQEETSAWNTLAFNLTRIFLSTGTGPPRYLMTTLPNAPNYLIIDVLIVQNDDDHHHHHQIRAAAG